VSEGSPSGSRVLSECKFSLQEARKGFIVQCSVKMVCSVVEG
jgi:hypothetical protein